MLYVKAKKGGCPPLVNIFLSPEYFFGNGVWESASTTRKSVGYWASTFRNSLARYFSHRSFFTRQHRKK